ncbi:hypothetical protein ES708_10529 [subsurface metagenome]
MDTIHFGEKQRFRGIVFYILLGLLQALFLWGLIQQVIFNKPWGTNPASDNALIIINIGVVIFILFFFSINLKTVITNTCISFRMFPFHIKKKNLEWSVIKDVKIVKYDGIKEYWGYGLRFMPGKGWCYTISGDHGIRLILMNEKKILIGTHRAKEISQIFDDLKNNGIINITD